MTKPEAVKNARIGVLLKGGTYYVTRKGDKYDAVSEYHYQPRRHGKVAEMFDSAKVRSTCPPDVTK